jgi:hypothetical protein
MDITDGSDKWILETVVTNGYYRRVNPSVKWGRQLFKTILI